MTNTLNGAEFEKPTIMIEKPTTDDAEQVAQLSYNSWIETYPNEEYGITEDFIKELRAHRISPEGIDSLKERLKRLEDDPSFFMVVAKSDDGNILGFIDGEAHEDATELQDLFVAKEAHGSGIASQLWGSFKSWADSEKPIWLNVVPYTDRAPAFYKKVGFEMVEGSEGFYKDTPLPIVKMERPAGL